MSAARNALALEIEELEDDRDRFAAMLARVEAANQEWVPLSVVKRLSACENPVTVWRDHRKISMEDLALRANLPPEAVRSIEEGVEPVRVRDLAAIGRALRVSLDSLVPWTEEGEPDRLRD